MKAYIPRTVFLIFAAFFYYIFLGSFFTFDISKYPSHISFLVPVVMLLIAVLFTPSFISWGVFLFFKYPHYTRRDFLYYCLFFPAVSIAAIFLACLAWGQALG
ncbi:hypothetical protein KJ652_00185 [Patescibacteria group bacterium]|nr:hypothetical protein [Patescibacteria group bacterium]MBU1122991.1 hypothetical protein [Patescibacteria group bacterium]